MNKLSGVLFLTALFSSNSYAAGSGTEIIKESLDAGRFNEAYNLATTYVNSSEGDPEFDFNYGVAAINSGHVSEGVFALERLVLTDSENVLVRVELARGYYLLKLLIKSKQLLNTALQQSPPEEIRSQIVSFLQLIEQESLPVTSINSFLEVGRGFDSNINSAPASQTSLVRLSDDSLEQSDKFNHVRLRAGIDHKYRADKKLDFSLDGELRYYDTKTEQNSGLVTFNVGHVWIGQKNNYRLGGAVQKFWSDGDSYRDLSEINASWLHMVDERSQFKLSSAVSFLDYVDSDWNDGAQHQLQGSYFRIGEGRWQPFWFTGLFVGDITPNTASVLSKAQVDRLFWGGNFGVQLKPLSKLTLTSAITYQSSRYEGEDRRYGVKRQDALTMLHLGLRWSLDNSWDLLANINSTHMNSNIELYEYTRSQAMLGVRYNF